MASNPNIFREERFIRLKALSNTSKIWVSWHIKKEKVSLPIDVRRTPLLELSKEETKAQC